VDLSESEVRHARRRAAERGTNVFFAQGDLEKLPLPDEPSGVLPPPPLL